MAFFEKFTQGLKKTREGIMGHIDSMINSFVKIDEEFFEELEELLVAADVGVHTAGVICDKLRAKVKEVGESDPNNIKLLLRDIVAEMLSCKEELNLETKPSIILIIGVNGVGKTTSIGKLASYLSAKGKKVLLSAADTFRAGAIEQLQIWADRAKTDIVRQEEGSDPASVIFDSITAAKSRDVDVVICDTAGRLHNKKHLMDELSKINRIIDRELPDASKEILLVLDASTGQNAINQAREFKNATGITGIILTKLDGTAKGGVVLAIKEELNIPVKFIGVGEKLDDLQPFSALDFANAIFETEDTGEKI
jgi:fused signal recognition particle receptor